METGLALPDITLIPALAGFFGVSADYLLGIDTECSDKVIENVLGDVSRLKHIAKAEEGIALIEKRFGHIQTIINCLQSGWN